MHFSANDTGWLEWGWSNAYAETSSMRYHAQNRHQYQDRGVQVDLPALERLSLSEVFKALEGNGATDLPPPEREIFSVPPDYV
jgi:hypothetical protein